MADEVLLRACAAADIEAVLELWRRAGAVPRPSDQAEALRARIAHDDGLFLLAVEGSRVVGSLIGAWDGWRGGHYRLAVDPAVRRRGVATRLVEEVERRMLALGAERVAIRVFHGEPGAVAFWRRSATAPSPTSRSTRRTCASPAARRSQAAASRSRGARGVLGARGARRRLADRSVEGRRGRVP